MQKKESTGAIVWRFIYPLLLFLGIDVVLEIILVFAYLAKVMVGGALTPENVRQVADDMVTYIYDKALIITLIRSVILVPIYFVFLNRDVKRDKEYGRYVEYSPYNKSWLLLLPFAGFAAAMGFNHVVPIVFEGLQKLIFNIFSIDVDFFATYDELSQVVYSGGIVLQVVTTAVVVPMVEELLFRGLIHKRIRTYLGVLPSTLISAFVFGFIHGNAIQFLYAFIIGLFLAYVYEKFKTIWAPIIFHAGANLIAVLVTNFVGEEIGLTTGAFMLVVVGELALAFILLKVIDLKVNRKPV